MRTMRSKFWTLALFALTSVAAFAQVPVIGSTVNAAGGGFQYHGLAPSGDYLCGNGTNYVDSATPCTIPSYQTIHNPVGTALPQEPVLTFSASFSCTDFSGASTQCTLAGVGTAGTYANPISVTTNAFGQVTGITAATTPQHLTIIGHKGSASCTPPGTSFATCTDTITWNQAFPDTNYTATCSFQSPVTATDAGSNALNLYPHAATATTTLTVSVQNLTSDPTITAGDIVCIGQEF